ncbi:hypothetical protein ACFE04_023156 [Oxalis oulophora]
MVMITTLTLTGRRESSLIGHIFEYEGKDPSSDLVVRFCKDVETRAQSGYVDFGRFDKYNHFVAGSGRVDFVQGFYDGDLAKCEHTYDKMGRTAQVNIICGSCANGQCEAGLGCICNVTYESTCRVIIELAIPCEKPGPRVFKGFTVGFHPRSSEIVYNGMTQVGFEKPNKEYSFKTEQTHLSLYMTAIASISSLVQKPIVEVSGFWIINISEYSENEVGNSTRRWAIFGILSCMYAFFFTPQYDSEIGTIWLDYFTSIFMVSSTLVCCGGFIYKTRMEGQHGIYALPGMTFLSACLDTVSVGGSGPSYSRPEEVNNAFSPNEVSWERPPAQAQVPTQGAWRPNERKYGAI